MQTKKKGREREREREWIPNSPSICNSLLDETNMNERIIITYEMYSRHEGSSSNTDQYRYWTGQVNECDGLNK